MKKIVHHEVYRAFSNFCWSFWVCNSFSSWCSSIWWWTCDITFPDSFLKLVQKVQMIQGKLIQLKIVTWIRFFVFDLELGSWQFLWGSNYGVSLYFRAWGWVYLFSEIDWGTDGFCNFVIFGIYVWKLYTFAYRHVRTFPDGSGLDDLLYFFLLY